MLRIVRQRNMTKRLHKYWFILICNLIYFDLFIFSIGYRTELVLSCVSVSNAVINVCLLFFLVIYDHYEKWTQCIHRSDNLIHTH